MLGAAGLQFGRSRGGEDRFYNPVKARRNRLNQTDLTQSTTTVSGTNEPENSPVCNLERFLESVTPSVPAQHHPSKVSIQILLISLFTFFKLLLL